MSCDVDSVQIAIFDGVLTRHNAELEILKASYPSLQAKVVKDLTSFESTCNNLLIASEDIIQVRLVLEASLGRIKEFVKILQVYVGKEHLIQAIWTIVVAVLENSTTDSKEKRRTTVDEIASFGTLLPRLTKSEEVYKAALTQSGGQILFTVSDLFLDVLSFHLQLLRTNFTSSKSKFSMTKFKKSAQTRDLPDIRIVTQGHRDTFDELIDAIVIEQLSTLATTYSEESTRLQSSATGTANMKVAPPRSLTQKMANVPTKSGNFFGRTDEISRIHLIFSATPDISTPDQVPSDRVPSDYIEPLSCVIHGLGGVGKTDTALQYAWKYASLFDWVLWVRSETEADFLKSYIDIGKKVGLIEGHHVAGPTAMAEIQDWLETTEERWLVVFDNVSIWDASADGSDDTAEIYLEDITKFWPRVCRNSSCIIFTTQTTADHPLFERRSGDSIQLKPFTPTEGAQFLLSRARSDGLNEEERKDVAIDIAKDIGGLPLYMNQATAYMRGTQMALTEYLEILHASNTLPEITTSHRRSRNDKPANAVFDTALQGLSAEARDLLNVLAFLNSEAIPESMIFSDGTGNGLDFLRKNNKPLLIQQLGDYDLVRRDIVDGEPCLATHRSVQLGTHAKFKDAPEKQQASFNIALQLLQAALPTPSKLQQPDDKSWDTLEKFMPHVRSLELSYRKAKQDLSDAFQLAKLLTQLGVNLYDRGWIKIGERFMQTSQTILGDSSSLEAIELRADVHIFLGIFTDTLGITRRDAGLKHREAALALRKHLLDNGPPRPISVDEDILLHNAVMDLSCSYQQFNRFDQVEKLSNECFRKYQTWGNLLKYRYEYAKYFHSMSFVFVYRGLTERAIGFSKLGSDLMGAGSPGSLLSTVYGFDHAICLFQHGMAQEAIHEQEKILEIRIAKCGKSNPLTLQSYLILGAMSYFAKHYSEAEAWIRKVLIHHQKAYWPQENIARAKWLFSRILQSTTEAAPSHQPTNFALTSAHQKKSKTEGDDAAEEVMSRAQLANVFLSEAETILDELLPLERQKSLFDDRQTEELNRALLYDYMAPWGYRLIVQRAREHEDPMAEYYDKTLRDMSKLLEESRNT